MVEADHYIKPNQIPPCAESIALERKGNGESELAVTVPCLGIKSYFSVVETGSGIAQTGLELMILLHQHHDWPTYLMVDY